MEVFSSGYVIPAIGVGIILFGISLLRSGERKNSGQHTPAWHPHTRTATPMLDAFSLDFTALARAESIDPGVGKTAIVEGLAMHIITQAVPLPLQNKRLVSLQVTKLLSDTKYRGEFEKRINKILEEIGRTNR